MTNESSPPRPRGTVLVTGVCGRLGKRLVRALHKEANVVGVDRRPFADRPSDVVHEQVDIRRKKLKDVFREWLASEFPDHAGRVINLLRSMHGGADYVAEFGVRQKGRGPYADQIALRFRLAMKRLGLNERRQKLRLDLFTPPVRKGGQIPLL